MTKDQKADTGGDPWESRRPLIHHWAPGQEHGTCEPLWNTLPTWSLRQGSHAVWEKETGWPSHWHLPAGSPKAQSVCSASEAVSIAGDGVCQGCADRKYVQTCRVLCAQSGNYSSCFLPPRCLPGSRLPWSPLTQKPEAGEAPAWFLPGIVPSLRPCPQLLSLLANWVLGVGFEMSLLRCCWQEFGVTAALVGINAHVCMGLGIPLQSLGLPNPHMVCVYVPQACRRRTSLCASVE